MELLGDIALVVPAPLTLVATPDFEA
jgi:hypothetical protein